MFDPADETALAREVRAGIINEGSFQKGSPEPGDDAYFGGKPGASKEAFEAMQKQYGDKKGEEVYFATRNKKKGKNKSSASIAEQYAQLEREGVSRQTASEIVQSVNPVASQVAELERKGISRETALEMIQNVGPASIVRVGTATCQSREHGSKSRDC